MKKIVLGTALWGWTISKEDAFDLLDIYSETDDPLIDTATNYPINKDIKSYGLALNWISDWLKHRKNKKVKILVKIGSINNLGTPDFDLTSQKMLLDIAILQKKFDDHLKIISVHWDNRDESQAKDVCETISVLNDLHKKGYQVGLSGIRHPHIYANLLSVPKDKIYIQVKENLATHQSRLSYCNFFKQSLYLAYGINMGGVKRAGELKSSQESISVRGLSIDKLFLQNIERMFSKITAITSFIQKHNHLALLSSLLNPNLNGIIIGPRNKEQLLDTFRTLENIQRLSKNELGEVEKILNER